MLSYFESMGTDAINSSRGTFIDAGRHVVWSEGPGDYRNISHYMAERILAAATWMEREPVQQIAISAIAS